MIISLVTLLCIVLLIGFEAHLLWKNYKKTARTHPLTYLIILFVCVALALINWIAYAKGQTVSNTFSFSFWVTLIISILAFYFHYRSKTIKDFDYWKDQNPLES